MSAEPLLPTAPSWWSSWCRGQDRAEPEPTSQQRGPGWNKLTLLMGCVVGVGLLVKALVYTHPVRHPVRRGEPLVFDYPVPSEDAVLRHYESSTSVWFHLLNPLAKALEAAHLGIKVGPVDIPRLAALKTPPGSPPSITSLPPDAELLDDRKCLWSLALPAQVAANAAVCKILHFCISGTKSVPVSWPARSSIHTRNAFFLYHLAHYAVLFFITDVNVRLGLLSPSTALPWEGYGDWLLFMGLVLWLTATFKYKMNNGAAVSDSTFDVVMQFVPGLGSDVSLFKTFLFIGLCRERAAAGQCWLANSLALLSAASLFTPLHLLRDLEVARSYIGAHWPIVLAGPPQLQKNAGTISGALLIKAIPQFTLAKEKVAWTGEGLQGFAELLFGIIFEFKPFVAAAFAISCVKVIGLPAGRMFVQEWILREKDPVALTAFLRANGDVAIGGRSIVDVVGSDPAWSPAVGFVYKSDCKGREKLEAIEWLTSDAEKTLADAEDTILSVAMAGEGRTLAVAGLDQTVDVYRLREETGRFERVQTLVDAKALLRSVAIAGEGRALAAAGDDRKVYVYRLREETGRFERVQTLDDARGALHSVAMAGEGRTLAAAGEDFDREVYVYRLREGTGRFELVQTLAAETGARDAFYSVAMAGEGRTLALASRSKVYVYRLREETGRFELLQTLADATGILRSVAMAGEGRTLAAASGDRKVYVYRLREETGRFELLQTLDDATDVLRSVAMAVGGRTLAAAGDDYRLRVYRLREETGLFELFQTLAAGPGFVFSVAMAGEGQTLASAGHERRVRVYDSWASILMKPDVGRA